MLLNQIELNIIAIDKNDIAKCVMISYVLETRISGPWWWKTARYWIVSEYGEMGPYKSREKAAEDLALIREFST